MKAAILILMVYTSFLLAYPVNAYCEDSASSGVIVIGSTEKSSSEAQTSEAASSENEDSSKSGESSPASAPFYEISGSKIGDTRVSQGVTLPSEGEVMFVDAGIAGGFTIVRVDKNGKETQALSTSPERAMGQKLAKGTYKVYPEDFDGRFPLDKLTVKVQVRVAENATGGAQ
jgi:hypothetical protein